jgi:tetratricopeptide (TPR) repeat protein
MAGIALECVGRRIPDNNAQNSWVTQRRLLRHLTRCWGYFIDGRLDDDGKDWVLYSFGYMCSNQGRLDEAEKMYQQALAGKEKAWGPEHTSTLDMVNNLGLLYANLGQLDEAEKMYQRALAGYTKALGKDAVKKYIPALNTAQNLANLFQQTGRAKEAEELYGQALFGVEAVFGRLSDRYKGIINALDTLCSDSKRDSC